MYECTCKILLLRFKTTLCKNTTTRLILHCNNATCPITARAKITKE